MTASARVQGEPVPGPSAADLEADQRRRRRKAIVLLIMLAGLLILLLLFGWYLIFRQPINPIPLIPVSEVPKYQTAIYGVKRPVGVASTPSGDRIYVTQSGQPAEALIFDGGGKPAGTMAPPDAGEHQSMYVAIDPKTAEVYISDRPAGAIYVYSAEGAFRHKLAVTQDRPGWQPIGLAFDSAGILYVTDFSGPSQRVVVLDRTGKMVRSLGVEELLNFPNGVAVDKTGLVYVTDSNNGRLLIYGADGKLLGFLGRGSGKVTLGVPRGLAIDGANRVMAVDTTGGVVAVLRTFATGNKTLDSLGSFGELGSADGKFSFPNGVAVDSRGRVYVADTFNDRVQLWAY